MGCSAIADFRVSAEAWTRHEVSGEGDFNRPEYGYPGTLFVWQ
jgi:hypothetical protein